jgi:hypothetical protein
MKSYDASATINAPPEKVWAVPTDAQAYPQWDTGVERVEGSIAAGSTIKVISKLSPGRAFPVKVAEFDAPRQMMWNGGMPLGLFKGVRRFTLTPRDGATEFTMREEFSGPLLPLIWRTMPDLGPTFSQFALDLKARAESQ